MGVAPYRSMMKRTGPAIARKDLDEERREMYERVALKGEALSALDLRVFLYLSTRLTFDEPVHVAQIDIAEALGQQKTHISRSIKRLKAERLIEEEEARSSAWRLNPRYGK